MVLLGPPLAGRLGSSPRGRVPGHSAWLLSARCLLCLMLADGRASASARPGDCRRFRDRCAHASAAARRKDLQALARESALGICYLAAPPAAGARHCAGRAALQHSLHSARFLAHALSCGCAASARSCMHRSVCAASIGWAAVVEGAACTLTRGPARRLALQISHAAPVSAPRHYALRCARSLAHGLLCGRGGFHVPQQ